MKMNDYFGKRETKIEEGNEGDNNKTKQIQQGPWPRLALTVDLEPRSVIHSVFGLWRTKTKQKMLKS